MIGILKNWRESRRGTRGRMRGMSQTRSASFLLFGLLILFSYMPDIVFTQSPPVTSETAYVYPLGCRTAYYVVEPSREATASVGAVLLLHGQRYTSQTWLDLGTLAFLSNSGLRAFAIDLPSFGRSGLRRWSLRVAPRAPRGRARPTHCLAKLALLFETAPSRRKVPIQLKQSVYTSQQVVLGLIL